MRCRRRGERQEYKRRGGAHLQLLPSYNTLLTSLPILDSLQVDSGYSTLLYRTALFSSAAALLPLSRLARLPAQPNGLQHRSNEPQNWTPPLNQLTTSQTCTNKLASPAPSSSLRRVRSRFWGAARPARSLFSFSQQSKRWIHQAARLQRTSGDLRSSSALLRPSPSLGQRRLRAEEEGPAVLVRRLALRRRGQQATCRMREGWIRVVLVSFSSDPLPDRR